MNRFLLALPAAFRSLFQFGKSAPSSGFGIPETAEQEAMARGLDGPLDPFPQHPSDDRPDSAYLRLDRDSGGVIARDELSVRQGALTPASTAEDFCPGCGWAVCPLLVGGGRYR